MLIDKCAGLIYNITKYTIMITMSPTIIRQNISWHIKPVVHTGISV